MAERSFFRALADATDGVVTTLRGQQNFRTQVTIAAIVVIAAALLHFDAIRWSVLIIAMGAVLAAELFNTALERAVDCASPQESAIARDAKHAGAGAVLVAAVMAVAVGAVLFGSAVWHR